MSGWSAMLLHRHRGYRLVCIWGSLVKFQGSGVVIKFDVFCTLMQFVCAVCMQAMTHPVDNVPSQQAVELLVLGLGIVEQCWLRLVCIWGSLVKFQGGGVVVKTMLCARGRIR